MYWTINSHHNQSVRVEATAYVKATHNHKEKYPMARKAGENKQTNKIQ